MVEKPNEEFVAVAERYGSRLAQDRAEVVAAAKAEFPDFEATIEALCR